MALMHVECHSRDLTQSAIPVVTKVADSVDSVTGVRLTTFHIHGFWKVLLQEIERHRVLSFCSGSSRAMPAKLFRAQVRNEPFVPGYWGKNQGGMQAREELTGWRKAWNIRVWLLARWAAILASWCFEKMWLHKQLANRVLEPWLWVDLVVSSTEWNNLWLLRDHPDAQPELQAVVKMMKGLYERGEPKKLEPGEWHLPFVVEADKTFFCGASHDTEDRTLEELKTISAARCARASYHRSGAVKTFTEDSELVERLKGSRPIHASPFEHVAQATGTFDRTSNFVGFRQWRKDLPGESGGDYQYPQSKGALLKGYFKANPIARDKSGRFAKKGQ